MSEQYIIRQIRDNEVIAEFVAKRGWNPDPIDNKPAAVEYARWFKKHYGLTSDRMVVVFDL